MEFTSEELFIIRKALIMYSRRCVSQAQADTANVILDRVIEEEGKS
jgi:hypothetical protein